MTTRVQFFFRIRLLEKPLRKSENGVGPMQQQLCLKQKAEKSSSLYSSNWPVQMCVWKILVLFLPLKNGKKSENIKYVIVSTHWHLPIMCDNKIKIEFLFWRENLKIKCNRAERKMQRRSAVVKVLIRVTFHGCKKIFHAAWACFHEKWHQVRPALCQKKKELIFLLQFR